jgi:putative MFS transporter
MTEPTTMSANDVAVRRARISARLDRLPVSGLSPAVFLVLGLSYAVAFYDTTVIGVALPRIAGSLKLEGAGIELPITMALIGYVIGAQLLSNLADRFGRRRMLAVAVIVLAGSALLTAFSQNGAELAAFRFLAGMGLGAQVPLAGTLLGEFAPAEKRGRFFAQNILWAAIGNIVPAVIAIPLLAGDGSMGWRVMFGLVAIIVFTLFLFRDSLLPESPRWLAARGDLERAERIVADMEARVQRKIRTGLPAIPDVPVEEEATGFPAAALLRKPFLSRVILVFVFWFAVYFAVFGFNAYQTTLFGKLGIPLPSTLVITTVGLLGGLAGALVQPLVIDRLERKHNIMIGLGIFTLGFVVLALAPAAALVAIGAFLVFLGIFLTLVPAYAYTSEVFPTRARAAAMGVGDGFGHLGGAVQPFLVVPLLAAGGPRPVFWVLAVVVVIALLIMSAGIRTRGRSLSELSQ